LDIISQEIIFSMPTFKLITKIEKHYLRTSESTLPCGKCTDDKFRASALKRTQKPGITKRREITQI
jgi:hypothetical protein